MGIDDLIKRKLTRGGSNLVELPCSITIRDAIIADSLLTHLDQHTVENYLIKDNSGNLRKKLLVIDLYAKHYGDKGVYELLENQSINMNMWGAYVGKKLEKKLLTFAFSLHEKKPRDKKTYEYMIEQVVKGFLNTDISKKYASAVSGSEYNLLVLCDSLLLAGNKTKDAYTSLREKMMQINNLFDSYRLHLDGSLFDSIHLLKNVPELKY